MHKRVGYPVDSTHQAAKVNDTNENLPTAAQSNTGSVSGSAEALTEILTYLRPVLTDLHHIRDQNDIDNGLTNIKILRRKNALLKKVVSELDRLINEKL